MFKINKKLLLLIVSFSLVFSNAVYAQTCEVSNVKQVLKKVVYLHLMEPQSSQLTLDEIKDLLFFYLGIDEGLITVDCSALGPKSNKPVSDIVSSGETAPDKVPACADGTEYGECSTFKPKYCYAGSLLHRCNYCGCPSASGCSTDGKCEAVKQNITCYNDIDCGTSQFTGNYYCSNNYITKNYQNYTCENAGTVNSGCVIKTSYVSIEYCDSSLNQTCIEGQSTCKTVNVSIVNETTNVTNQTTLSPTGVCEVRDSYTSVPLFSAPDVGVGYAKKAITGVNTLDGLKIGCTNSTFYVVMQSYCTQNSNPMQQELVTYNSAGNWQSTTCGANGCSYYFCKYLNYPPPNSGVCMVSDAYTSISQIAFWDPDVGKGYAKMAKNGINTITGLQAICTKADYDTLVQKYCAQNSNQVQEGVVTYGPGGGMTSSSCGAFGCAYRSCSTITNQTSNQTNQSTTSQTNLSVTLISPNGGEVLQKGSTYAIQWTNPLQGGFSGSQNMGWAINLFRPDGVWIVGNTLPVTQSSYQWAIPNTLSDASDYKVRVFLAKNCIYSAYPCPEPSQILTGGSSDDSNAAFSIISASQTTNQTSNQTTNQTT